MEQARETYSETLVFKCFFFRISIKRGYVFNNVNHKGKKARNTNTSSTSFFPSNIYMHTGVGAGAGHTSPEWVLQHSQRALVETSPHLLLPAAAHIITNTGLSTQQKANEGLSQPSLLSLKHRDSRGSEWIALSSFAPCALAAKLTAAPWAVAVARLLSDVTADARQPPNGQHF